MRNLIAGIALLLATAAPGFAADPIYKKDGVALSGYDAVAYFTEGKAARGTADFETRWRGATWRFGSAANRDAFAAAPEKYAPQYGGYCAWAVSRDYTYEADPEAWRIVEGKLYLNYDLGVQKKWAKELPQNIERANRNWPAVLTRTTR